MLTIFNLKLSCYSHVVQTVLIRALSTSRLKEYYDLLDCQKSSTPKEIKESFLRLSKIYHPDNKTTGSHLRFVQLKEAYDAIKDGPPATSDINRPSTRSNSYSTYDEHADLSHKAHAYHRERNRDYANSRSQYFRSQTPWEDFTRDRSYERQRQEYDRFAMGKMGKPLISFTVIFGAIAWIVIYSSFLLIWDFNSHAKNPYRHNSRGFEDYEAYKEYIERKRTENQRQRDRRPIS